MTPDRKAIIAIGIVSGISFLVASASYLNRKTEIRLMEEIRDLVIIAEMEQYLDTD